MLLIVAGAYYPSAICIWGATWGGWEAWVGEQRSGEPAQPDARGERGLKRRAAIYI